jgi:hypothetical protein
MGEEHCSILFAVELSDFVSREDEKFFEMLSSIDEFQSPLVVSALGPAAAAQSSLSTRAESQQQDDFELIYLYGIQDTTTNNSLFNGSSFLNSFETVEVRRISIDTLCICSSISSHLR